MPVNINCAISTAQYQLRNINRAISTARPEISHFAVVLNRAGRSVALDLVAHLTDLLAAVILFLLGLCAEDLFTHPGSINSIPNTVLSILFSSPSHQHLHILYLRFDFALQSIDHILCFHNTTLNCAKLRYFRASDLDDGGIAWFRRLVEGRAGGGSRRVRNLFHRRQSGEQHGLRGSGVRENQQASQSIPSG